MAPSLLQGYSCPAAPRTCAACAAAEAIIAADRLPGKAPGGVVVRGGERYAEPIYLMWSDTGERTVDLAGELSGQVRVTNADDEESVMDGAALLVTEEPLLVQPLK